VQLHEARSCEKSSTQHRLHRCQSDYGTKSGEQISQNRDQFCSPNGFRVLDEISLPFRIERDYAVHCSPE
jgi:hypothetical protein